MFRQLLFMVFCVLFGSGDAFAGTPNPFRVEGKRASAAIGQDGIVQVLVHVPKDHHLYRDMMEVTRMVDEASTTVVTGEASFPPGFVKPDPADPSATREQYDMDVVIDVPVKGVAEAGNYTLKFEVRYQGCKKSLCWMPQTDVVEVTLKVGKDKK